VPVMPITLAVGADNSRGRHHVFFIFAFRPKMCPALRCSIEPESLFARRLWHHPADAIVTSGPARFAWPITLPTSRHEFDRLLRPAIQTHIVHV
jgi:hypothetical protein